MAAVTAGISAGAGAGVNLAASAGTEAEKGALAGVAP